MGVYITIQDRYGSNIARHVSKTRGEYFIVTNYQRHEYRL